MRGQGGRNLRSLSSEESSSPHASSSSLPLQLIVIVCLLYLEFILPSSVPTMLSAVLSAWQVGLFKWPFVIVGGVKLPSWAVHPQVWGKKDKGRKKEGWRGSGRMKREEEMKGGRKQWERKSDLKRENKSSLRFKWLRERAFFAPDTTPNYER